MIPEGCDKCSGHPVLQKQWGCKEALQVAAERIPNDEGVAYEYFNCPIKFIAPSVTEFSHKYQAIKGGFARPPEFGQESAQFAYFRAYYEMWFNWFVKRKNNNA